MGSSAHRSHSALSASDAAPNVVIGDFKDRSQLAEKVGLMFPSRSNLMTLLAPFVTFL